MSQSTAEKALSINLNRPLYGTLAEIGAGQEVARWFFKVGGAAGTIAKAMSAYDKTFSDAVYGVEDSGRYVVEDRLKKMLQHEFQLLEDRLTEPDLKEKYFFAFADTVAAKSYKYNGDCHGWMGIRFQRDATEAHSQIVIHVRMLDKTPLQQQEALGILGVNLIYGAFHHFDNRDHFTKSLGDGHLPGRVEINTIRFQGPAFEKEINPISDNLYLIKHGLTPSLLIKGNGTSNPLSEELYKKQVICYRYEDLRSPKLFIEVLENGKKDYCGNKTEGSCDPILIHELFAEDFSKLNGALTQKIHSLVEKNQNILLTTLKQGFELTEHIGLFTDNHINLILQTSQLSLIVNELNIHSLEPVARVFNDTTRIFIHPNITDTGGPKTLSEFVPPKELQFLFRHLVDSKYLREIIIPK